MRNELQPEKKRSAIWLSQSLLKDKKKENTWRNRGDSWWIKSWKVSAKLGTFDGVKVKIRKDDSFLNMNVLISRNFCDVFKLSLSCLPWKLSSDNKPRKKTRLSSMINQSIEAVILTIFLVGEDVKFLNLFVSLPQNTIRDGTEEQLCCKYGKNTLKECWRRMTQLATP